MKFTEWKVNIPNSEKVSALADALSVSRLCAKLLVSRGLDDPYKAKKFLNCDLSVLHDPNLLPDMQVAVRRIRKALAENEKITVYGDYDVDGTTATYILYDYLSSTGAQCDYYIPNRIDEGYGVNLQAVNKLINSGTSLIITVDTGITAHKEVEFARSRDCDFVITDHHECRETLPDAVAVINPHREDSGYPFVSLAGVGVAFKLICAIQNSICEKYLPFVCIGTVADVMPITDENRAIVSYGLKALENTKHTALSALIEKTGLLSRKLTADSIGFALAPRINAAGRMGSATQVVELFEEESVTRALDYAQNLCNLNQKRQEEERKILGQVQMMLAEVFDEKRDSAIVLAGEGWHHGVIGIVASKLSGKYDVPVILLAKDGEEAKGSGRGIFGMNLYEALCGADNLLTQYGGHEMAVGLTLPCENINALREHINECAKKELMNVAREVRADFEVNAEELTVAEIEGLDILQPFGEANASPLLVLRGAYVEKITPIGKGKHLKITLSQNRRYLDAVYFGNTVNDISFTAGEVVDVMFRPDINDFRGKAPQLIVSDIRPIEKELKKVCKSDELYRKVREDRADVFEYQSILPDYTELGAIWRTIKKFCVCAPDGFSIIKISEMVKIPYEKIFIALDVFKELGLLKYDLNNLRIKVQIIPTEDKVNLEDSKILREIALKTVG